PTRRAGRRTAAGPPGRPGRDRYGWRSRRCRSGSAPPPGDARSGGRSPGPAWRRPAWRTRPGRRPGDGASWSALLPPGDVEHVGGEAGQPAGPAQQVVEPPREPVPWRAVSGAREEGEAVPGDDGEPVCGQQLGDLAVGELGEPRVVGAPARPEMPQGCGVA